VDELLGGNRKVLAMARIQYIKYLREKEDKSLREIEKITGISYPTVQKYAKQEDFRPNETIPKTAPKFLVCHDYIPIIDEWLEGDNKVPRKQRHTAKRIYDRLRDEYKFKGGYTSVKVYMRFRREQKQTNAQGFLPLMQPPGHAECDFGDCVYYDGKGNTCDGHALTVSFPQSNKGYTQVFPSENQECLLEGLKRIFNHIGGVPVKLRTDNMTTAVVHVVSGKERVLTDGFTRFMLHYHMDVEFCNPASPEEKGNVENKVGYSRRNMLVPVPTITDFEEFNHKLLDQCERDGEREHYRHHVPISELWEEDKKKLLVLPEYEYPVFKYESAGVDKNGLVSVDKNKYGVSPSLAEKRIQYKLSFNRVEIYYNQSLVASYERHYGRSGEYSDWANYLQLLCVKPGGAEHTRFFDQMPRLWQEHISNTQGKGRKNALILLSEIVSDGNRDICEEAIELAAENGRIDTDSIRQCYYMITKKEYRPAPLPMVDVPSLSYSPDLSVYDALVHEGSHHG